MNSRWRAGRRRLTVVVAAALGAGVVSVGLLAAPALADAPESQAAKIARATPLVDGTPCTIAARACVDLDKQHAWLFENGTILRGPVDISSGGKGEETPTGHALRVYRKDINHVSQESRGPDGQPSKMPFSVFFEDGGIAFHGGDLDRASAGCIHLAADDAKAWYDYLHVGDQVQVVYGDDEIAAREGKKLDHDRNSDADAKRPAVGDPR